MLILFPDSATPVTCQLGGEGHSWLGFRLSKQYSGSVSFQSVRSDEWNQPLRRHEFPSRGDVA